MRFGIAVRTAALGLFLLSAVSGCATAGRKAEDEAQRKKARAHFDLGVDHLENGRVAIGLRELMSAEQLDPRNPRIHYGLAEAYLMKGRLAEAEAHLRRALEIHPAFHDARLHLSALFIHQERYEEAFAESERLIADPTFPGAWRALTNSGWAALQLGRLPQARERLEQALDMNARYWPTLLDLGILEAREGHHLEAISYLERALKLAPSADAEAEIEYRLAEVFVSLGNRERAVGHLRSAVARTPAGRWGKKSEEYLRLLR